jgi:hypothetical protein
MGGGAAARRRYHVNTWWHALTTSLPCALFFQTMGVLGILGCFEVNAKSFCANEIERALEAHRVLLENLNSISNPALQGLVSGYLDANWMVCDIEDIDAVQAPTYIINRSFGGYGNVSYIFSATHASGCSINLSIDTPKSRLRNIVASCKK